MARLAFLIPIGITFGLSACSALDGPTANSPAVATSLPMTDGLRGSPEPLERADDAAGAALTNEAAPTLTEAPGLSATYFSCATSDGLEFAGVQVFVSSDGVPKLVKTGVDVPAEIHARCWSLIGGTPTPGASSWGDSVEVSPTRPTDD